MRYSPLALAVVAVACTPPKPKPVVTVAPTADTLVVPAVSVTAVSSRSDGSWVVLAPTENQVFVANFATKSVKLHPGINATEVPHPVTLIGVGDSIVVGDWGLSRFTEWSPAGQRLSAWPAPAALQHSSPRARDAAGQWYFQVSSDAKADGSNLLDSSMVVRSDPQLSRFDTVARLTPGELVRLNGMSGMHYQRRTMGGDDTWGVRPDGTLWVARVFQNQIEWHFPDGQKIERSPQLPDPVLTVSDMDREIYVRRFPEDQRQAARELPNTATKPPFEHVFSAPDGRMWLAKSDTALAPVRHLQVVDKSGVLFTVAVPSRGFALAVNSEFILMGEEFPGGIRLLRYPVPSEMKTP